MADLTLPRKQRQPTRNRNAREMRENSDGEAFRIAFVFLAVARGYARAFSARAFVQDSAAECL
jgi:hypothetical protein